MKILNTHPFHFINDREGTTYRGYIKLSKAEFKRVVNKIMRDKEVLENAISGAGPHPYLSKKLLKEDIEKTRLECKGCTQYALRNAFAVYVTNLFKNESRYYFKPQNYIIQVNN